MLCRNSCVPTDKELKDQSNWPIIPKGYEKITKQIDSPSYAGLNRWHLNGVIYNDDELFKNLNYRLVGPCLWIKPIAKQTKKEKDEIHSNKLNSTPKKRGRKRKS